MSFSAEMRDFLNAYKTGQAINASRTDQDYKEVRAAAEKAKMDRDNDPETLDLAKRQAQATLAATQDRMSSNAAARGVSAARVRLLDAQRKAYEDAQKPQPTGLLPEGAVGPGTIQPGSALPVSPGPVGTVGNTLDTGEDAYAEGGLVPDDESAEITPDDEEAEGEGVLPTSGTSGATDFSAARREPQPKPGMGVNGIISPQLVADATKAGLMFGIQKAGLGQGAVRTPAAMLKAKQIAQGMGGLSEQEMQAAKQAVDPQGKLTESQRNLAALGSVYQFWANKGEPEKAQKVAFQMLQYYRNTSQRYAAIAAQAAQGGNMDLATKAALKAYQNVPDAKDLQIEPNPDGGLMYTYTDQNGDVIAKGIATPQQLAASAMGLATGGFDKALMSAAGAVPAEKKGAVDASGGIKRTSAERSKEIENIGGEIEKMKAAWKEKNKDTPVNEEEWSEIGNAAARIYQANPKATPNEAARAAHAMLAITGDPEKAPFKVTPGEDGSPSTVRFNNGLKIQMDDDQLDQVLNSRAARVKTAVDKINADMEEQDKPGFTDKAIEAGKTIAGGVSKLPTVPEAAAGAVKGAYGLIGKMLPDVPTNVLKQAVPEELISRVGSDLSKIESLVSGKYNNPAKNSGAIPVDDNDRPL